MKSFKQYLKEVHGDADYILGEPDDPLSDELEKAIETAKKDVQNLDDNRIKEFVNDNLRIFGRSSKVFQMPTNSLFPKWKDLFSVGEENPTTIKIGKYLKNQYQISLEKITTSHGNTILTYVDIPWTYDNQLNDREEATSPHNTAVKQEAKDYITNAVIKFVNDIKYHPDKLQWKES